MRFRQDPHGLIRRTTVELTLEDNPIQKRMMWITIPIGRPDLRAAAMQAGATWHSDKKQWRMTLETAKSLKLTTARSVKKG